MSSTTSYHHGNLRAALLDAAFAAASHGGSQALVVRDLARALGVSPAAAYHHFKDRDHLVAAVAQRARESMARQMIDAARQVPANVDPAARAVWRLAAIGQAYLDFSRQEPALLRMAFGPCPATPERPDDPAAWQLIVDALDDLVETKAMDPARRAGAELIVWSAVHGLSVLRNDGAFPPETASDTSSDSASSIDRIVLRGALVALGVRPPD